MKSQVLFIAMLVIAFTCATLDAQPIHVRIWPGKPPGSIANPAYPEDTVFTEKGLPRVRHVTDPELVFYFPPGKHQDLPAVIVCPGGSYARLAIDHEGHAVAQWLAGIGVAGIVLKYRLPSDTIMTNKSIGPLQDVQEAIRIVRRRSSEWGINPAKVGVMGFSAGGHLAGSASTLYDYRTYEPSDSTSARPDFSILVYGVLSMKDGCTHADSRKNLLGSHPDSALVKLFSAEENVTPNTPPAFIVHAANDPSVPVASSIRYFSALKTASVPAELHVYQTGGHGFGLGTMGGTESEWSEAFRKWLKARSILK